MSYRDPKQYIDTQSMQIQQNLQKTLAGIGTGVVSSINKIHADNAAKTVAIRAEADKRVAAAQNSIMQTQSKNPTTDFEDLDSQLDLMNKLLMKDPAKRTAEEKTFINSMETIGDNMANMLKNTAMSQAAMMDQVNKIPGTPGAIDPKENPDLYAKLSVLANQTEGRTKAKYKIDKNGQVVFSLDVYQKTKDGEKFVGNVINDNVATTQMPPVIPDVTKEMSTAIKSTINTNDFKSKFGEFINAEGAIIKDGKGGTGARVTEDYFRKQLAPNANMILAGLLPREKIRLYNNTLDKGNKPDLSYDDDLTGEGKEDLIKEALMNSLINETKATYNIFGVTKDLTEKKKGGTDIELTFPQQKQLQEEKRRIKVFNKTIEEGIKGDVPIIYSFNDPNVQAIRKKDKNGDVRWFLQQKSAQGKFSDVMDGGYTNIKFLSDALGYPKPSLPTKDS
jgi:hypothetical protein